MIKKHDGNEGNRKKLPSQKVEPASKHMAYLSGISRGTLDRNSTFREDARKRLKGLGIYDNEGNIKKGLSERDYIKKLPEKDRQAVINERIKLYKFDGVSEHGEILNFSYAGIPYYNQAHHILCCESFSKDHGWTDEQLSIVMDTTYDINNDFNIIFLPCVYGLSDAATEIPIDCLFHNLPNHAKRHNKYNDKIIDEVKKLQKFSQNVLDEPDSCDSMKNKLKILDQIYNFLIKIEDKYLNYLTSRGANVAMVN